MSNPTDTPEVQKMTRFQAQRLLGLWAPHDFVVGGLLVLSFVVLIVWAVVGDISAMQVCGVLLFDVVLALTQVIVLLYRCMTYILDLHASVETLPEASARIAAAYLQGKPVEPNSKRG